MIDTARKGIKNIYKSDITIRTLYPEFKKYIESQCSKTNNKLYKDLDNYKLYKSINDRYYELIRTKTIQESEIIKVGQLGLFFIIKKKMNIIMLDKHNTLKLDWGFYLKTGKPIYHLNEHTNYNRYGIKWLPPKYYGKPYKFVPTRKYTRGLAKEIFTNSKIDYVEYVNK